MTTELRSVPFSGTLKALIQRHLMDAQSQVQLAIERDAFERGYPKGTRFDLQIMCWLMPMEKKGKKK